MPYIPMESRIEIDEIRQPQSVGELTYKLADACDDYLLEADMTFSHLSEVIAALECTKLEIYRRLVAPYEDKKKAQNGDVFNAGD